MKSKIVDNQPQEITEYPEIDPKEQDAIECVNEIFKTPLTGSYNWDYTVVDDRIKKLYELGKRLNWNVSDDLDNKLEYATVVLFEQNTNNQIGGVITNTDGDFKFNTARLINHSCNPNCEVTGTGLKVWVHAIKDIKKGDEFSYDYGFSFDEDYKNYPCRCRSKNCCGYIVREGSRWRIRKKKKQK